MGSVSAGLVVRRRWRRTCSRGLPSRRRAVRRGARPRTIRATRGSTACIGSLPIVSTDSPLVLVVDDLQWCDAPSARALAFIARRLEGLPVALILASRPLDPVLTPEAAALLADPATEFLRPSPLTQAAVTALIAAQLSGCASCAVRRGVREGDWRQPVPARGAAERGSGSGARSDRLRRGGCRRGRPAGCCQRGAAARSAAGGAGGRARARPQRAGGRRSGGRRRSTGRTRGHRRGCGDGGAGLRGCGGVGRDDSVHPPDRPQSDL